MALDRTQRYTGEYREADRAQRVVGEREPTYRTEALHFRDDYGTSMDDTQYKGAEENRVAYEEAVIVANEGIAKAQGEVNTGYETLASERTKLDKAYASGSGQISGFNVDIPGLQGYNDWRTGGKGTKTVQVYTDGQLEGTYTLSKEQVDAMQAGDESGRVREGSGQVYVATEGYGKEVHDSLREAEQKNESDYNKAKADYDRQADAARAAVESQKAAARAQLESQYQGALGQLEVAKGQLMVRSEEIIGERNKLSAYEDERQANLGAIRNKYIEKLASMKQTITANAAKMVESNQATTAPEPVEETA